MRHEPTYKRMTPPSTQNLKTLGWRWRHSLIWFGSVLNYKYNFNLNKKRQREDSN